MMKTLLGLGSCELVLHSLFQQLVMTDNSFGLKKKSKGLLNLLKGFLLPYLALQKQSDYAPTFALVSMSAGKGSFSYYCHILKFDFCN